MGNPGSRSGGSGRGRRNNRSLSLGNDEAGDYGSDRRQLYGETWYLEYANAIFSFIWWMIGFYWVSADDRSSTHDSPQLYWLCIIFLASDVVLLLSASLRLVSLDCCLHFLLALLYAVADQRGATKKAIERLPKYKFRTFGDSEKQYGKIQGTIGGIMTMTECDTDTRVQHVLPLEDAECGICLCSYDDGTELRELPCRHHFHSACIEKWLYINATCPLCKFNVKNGS